MYDNPRRLACKTTISSVLLISVDNVGQDVEQVFSRNRRMGYEPGERWATGFHHVNLNMELLKLTPASISHGSSQSPTPWDTAIYFASCDSHLSFYHLTSFSRPMDAFAVVTTVFTLAQSINTWLEECAEKEVTIRQISGTVIQIQQILLPLHDRRIHIEPQTLGVVKTIGGALKGTQEHLLVWQDRRPRRILAALSPSTVTKQLKEDERQLNQQLVMLLASIAVVGFVEKQHKRRSVVPNSVTVRTKPAAQRPLVLESIKNEEVKEFWRGYVGGQLPYISGDEFCARLGAWMGEVLDTSARKGLLLRLDEFGIGGVTPAALESTVGTSSLRSVVETYARDINYPSSLSQVRARKLWLTKHKASKISLPLIVWIDDNPLNNEGEVEEAREMGVNVIQLTSTAIAKAWVESNSEFLRCNDHPSQVRFISDNHRDEPTSGPYLNISAGENILRYLRGRKYNIPVLIYCGASLNLTTYVGDYPLAGSTNSCYITMEFITALAQRRGDDTDWVGFDSMGSSSLA